MPLPSESQFMAQKVDWIIKDLLAAEREDEAFIKLMEDPTERTLKLVKPDIVLHYLGHTGTFVDRNSGAQDVLLETLRVYARYLKKTEGNNAWRHLVARSGSDQYNATFEGGALLKIEQIKQNFVEAMKEWEMGKLIGRRDAQGTLIESGLIDRDIQKGVLTAQEAESYRQLATEGRLVLYSTDGEHFDQYMAKDEWKKHLEEHPEEGDKTIILFNPLWGDQKQEVTVKEMGVVFDRKESLTIVGKLRQIQGLEDVNYDSENRKIVATVRTGRGIFRIEANLDDGTHEPHEFEVFDQYGDHKTFSTEELEELKGSDATDLMAFAEERRNRPEFEDNVRETTRPALSPKARSIELEHNLNPAHEAPQVPPVEVEIDVPTGLEGRVTRRRMTPAQLELEIPRTQNPEFPIQGPATPQIYGPGEVPGPIAGLAQNAPKLQGPRPFMGPAHPESSSAEQEREARREAEDKQEVAKREGIQEQVDAAPDVPPKRYTAGGARPRRARRWVKPAIAAGVGGTALSIPTFTGGFSLLFGSDSGESFARASEFAANWTGHFISLFS